MLMFSVSHVHNFNTRLAYKHTQAEWAELKKQNQQNCSQQSPHLSNLQATTDSQPNSFISNKGENELQLK